MKEKSDHEWFRQVKQGDSQALHALWEMLFTSGVVIARYYGQEDDLGRDAAIAAYLRIKTRGVHQFKFKSSFRWYSRRILINEVRRLLGKRTLEIVDLDEEQIKAKPLAIDPERIAAKIVKSLQPCLDQLKPRERKIITLRYLEEQKPEEIAAKLGISRNYVNVIAHRARRKLRQCLNEQGYDTVEDIL